MTMARADVISVFGPVDETLIAEVIATRASFEELREVNRVIPERVLAHVALVAEVFEKLRE